MESVVNFDAEYNSFGQKMSIFYLYLFNLIIIIN